MAKCKECGEVFTKSQLKKHLESEHGIAPEPIKTEPETETLKAEEIKAPEVPAVVEEPKPEPKPEAPQVEEGKKPEPQAKVAEPKPEPKPEPQTKPFIPEVGMRVWNRRSDLRKAFPNPQDEKCSYRSLKNFLAWMVQYCVKEEPEIAAYFKAQQGGK